MAISRFNLPVRRLHKGFAPLVLLLLAAVASTGCVRRRLTVRSNPPGAIVHVDNQQIGSTPCSVDYIHYGTREIRMELPGYETLTVNQPLPAPWYQQPGIDFVSENLVPNRIEDARTVSFNLQPRRLMAPEEIIARGEELRRQVTPVGAVPAGATFPISETSPPPGASAIPVVASNPGSPFTPRPAIPAASRPMTVVPHVSAPPAPGLQDTFRQ